jgi:hypothetical protein
VTYAYNKTINDVGVTFNYRLAPKVISFIEVSDTTFAYKDSGISANLNSNEQRYMLGATWEKTVQTKGSLKIGDLQKQFNSSAQSSYSFASWEGNVQWSPIELIRVGFDTAKGPFESTWATSSFELITNNSINVAYDLTALTSVQANVGNVVEEFVSASPYRKDTTDLFGFKLDYKIQNWLIAGVEYTNSKKTSTDSTVGYNRDVIMLSLRTQL